MIKVKLFDQFKRELKPLAKKFRTLVVELNQLIDELERNPTQGKSLGSGLYKIRLSSQSKGGGKSGGFRVITYYVETKNDVETVYLVSIYDKSEFSTVSKTELLKLIENSLH